MIQNNSDLELLEQKCRIAGDILLKYFGTDLDVERKPEAGNSPVTIADKEADDYLKTSLLAERADYGWLSEESVPDGSYQNAKRSFIVDPIDGTSPFIKGIPEFVISAAIVEDFDPVVAVVFNPVKNEMFTCAKGAGVFLNGKRMEKREKATAKHFLGSVSEYRKGLLMPFEQEWEIETVGSAAYKMALVASGFGDFTATFRPKSAWDIAAGHLMCEEAGLGVVDFLGKRPSYGFNKADDFVSNLLAAPIGCVDDVLLYIQKKKKIC